MLADSIALMLSSLMRELYMIRNVVGVVLAGGRSLRMGQDKAALAMPSGSLLAYQRRRLELLCPQVQVSSNGNDASGLPDRYPGIGPLAGIDAATQCFPGADLLVLPVDMPGVSTESLLRLMAVDGPAHFKGHPLPAYFPASAGVAKHIEALLAQVPPVYAVHALHTRLGSIALQKPDAEELANLNTPEDWQRFLATMQA